MSQGLASRSMVTALEPWILELDDPLTSLSTLTTYSGTWSISTYLQLVAATSVQNRARSNTALTTMTKVVLEAEVEIPASYGGSGTHWGIGVSSGNVAGNVTFGMRGDGYAYSEVDAIQAGATIAYTIPSAGTWVKMRLVNSGQRWEGYLDGVRYVGTIHSAIVHAQTWYPYIRVYTTSALTIKFRNYKAWSWAAALP